MKKSSREINIFSISALDLFASAMGAFILITIILLPYFPNTGDSPERIADLQKELEQKQKELEDAQKEIKKTFLLVVMSWKTSDDIDLHVVDPAGRRYYYEKRRFPESQARFEEDSIRGAGNEIWVHPLADSGRYKIYYRYYKKRQNSPVKVRGAIIHKNGRAALPGLTLTRQNENYLIATIIVSEDGTVSMQ